MRESKTGIKVEDLKGEELYGVLLKARGEQAVLPDDAIQRKLLAAEDFYERDLQIAFGDRRVFSDPQSRSNAGAPLQLSDFSESADLTDPAYDYDQDLWGGNKWAMIKLRRRPVRSITQVVFTWTPREIIWKVPDDWIVVDRKGGTVQIKPASGPVMVLSLSSYLLSTVAGGRGLPHSVYIDYRTGITPAELEADHQDLLEGIRLRTVLALGGIITSIATPGGQTGGSLSLDGLSRSRNFGGKFGAYSGKFALAIEQEADIRQSWGTKEKGVAVAFA